jgi:hypothetical protein
MAKPNKKVGQTSNVSVTRKPMDLKRTAPQNQTNVNFLYPNRRIPSQPLPRQSAFFGVRVGNSHRSRHVAISNGEMIYRNGANRRRNISVVNRLPHIVKQVLYSGKHRIQYASPYSSRSWMQVIYFITLLIIRTVGTRIFFFGLCTTEFSL